VNPTEFAELKRLTFLPHNNSTDLQRLVDPLASCELHGGSQGCILCVPECIKPRAIGYFHWQQSKIYDRMTEVSCVLALEFVLE